LIERCLREPKGCPPLCEMAKGKKSAAILIPGKARRAGARAYVPALVAELHRGGMADRDIEIFLADGTHEQHLASDLADLLGAELGQRVRCLGHNPHDETGMLRLGTSSFGTPILFNRRVLDAELKILTGRIVPHYFAGFSGGRKALLPGVAGFPTILA